MFRLLIAAFAALFVFFASESQAQQACAERAEVLKVLAERYGESRQTIGIDPQGNVVETFANTGTGTWTIVITRPNGMTCLAASGQAFEAVAETPAPSGDSL